MDKKIQYDTAALIASLEGTFDNATALIDRFDEQLVNQVPFHGSWTAAQVTDHLTLSNLSIAKALALAGTPINREPGERITELKDIFLDFETRLQAPSFVLPSENKYDKVSLLAAFRKSYENILTLAQKADLSAMINHSAFGDITKFEILHFVLYHTQRHTHQLEKIYKELFSKNIYN